MQRASDVEVIVVDDGSTTATDEVVASFDDSRVRLLHHDTPQGVSVARNAGAAVARTNWLAFVDDDDVWAPTKLSEQLLAATSTSRRWCCTGAVRVDERLRPLSDYRPLPPTQLVRQLRRWNCVPGGCSGVVLDRSLLREDELVFDPSLKHFADWELWVRLASRDLPAVVDKPLVGYRIHAGNKALETEGMVEDVRYIEHRHGISPDWGKIEHYLAWLHQRSGHRAQALRYFGGAAIRGQLRPVLRSLHSLADSRLRRGAKRRSREVSASTRADETDAWLRELRQFGNEIARTAAA
jgi:glycosyltransferase involved in cell wall biosynthesis